MCWDVIEMPASLTQPSLTEELLLIAGFVVAIGMRFVVPCRFEFRWLQVRPSVSPSSRGICEPPFSMRTRGSR